MKEPDLQRFESKIEKTETCWNWVASNRPDGYGRFWIEGRLQYAHRVSYQEANGPIDSKTFIDHMCHNTSCVRPEHLRATTNKQNLENRGGANKNSATGVRGVSWDTRHQCYVVQVKDGQKSHWGGYFPNIKDAELAAIELRNSVFTHNDLDRIH